MTRVNDGLTALVQTQFSYDALGRLDCTAVRMDIAQFIADASLSACTSELTPTRAIALPRTSMTPPAR